MMGMLLPLGIEKSKEFKPDAATVAGLNSAQHGELNKYQKKDSLKKWGEATPDPEQDDHSVRSRAHQLRCSRKSLWGWRNPLAGAL
jgi:hypothetical protein